MRIPRFDWMLASTTEWASIKNPTWTFSQMKLVRFYVFSWLYWFFLSVHETCQLRNQNFHYKSYNLDFLFFHLTRILRRMMTESGILGHLNPIRFEFLTESGCGSNPWTEFWFVSFEVLELVLVRVYQNLVHCLLSTWSFWFNLERTGSRIYLLRLNRVKCPLPGTHLRNVSSIKDDLLRCRWCFPISESSRMLSCSAYIDLKLNWSPRNVGHPESRHLVDLLAATL